MNVFSNLRAARDTLYNKVWRSPKGRLSAKVRKVCDGLPRNQRLMVVSIMLCAFVLIAFFVFGHACYRIGLGHARQQIEIQHIRQLDISGPENVKSSTPAANDIAGMENED